QHPSIDTHPQPECAFFLLDEEFEKGNDFLEKKYFGKSEKDKWLIKNVGILFYEKCLQRLYNHNPGVKIIVLLRNPVDRAYSAYWFARRRGWEKRTSFENALQEIPFKNNIIHYANTAYLKHGHYASMLEKLFAIFSADQVKVVFQ